jgi:hypothetical protein
MLLFPCGTPLSAHTGGIKQATHCSFSHWHTGLLCSVRCAPHRSNWKRCILVCSLSCDCSPCWCASQPPSPAHVYCDFCSCEANFNNRDGVTYIITRTAHLPTHRAGHVRVTPRSFCLLFTTLYWYVRVIHCCAVSASPQSRVYAACD